MNTLDKASVYPDISLEQIKSDILDLDGPTSYLGAEVIKNRSGDPCILFRDHPTGPVRYIYMDQFFTSQKASSQELDIKALDNLVNQHPEAFALLIKIGRNELYEVLITY